MVDNYFIRSLLGEKAFHVPVGAVSKQMLELAEHVLAQFDLIMVLEQVCGLQITKPGAERKRTNWRSAVG